MNKTMTPTEWGLLIFLSILWGGSFFFGEVALNDMSPFSIVLGRVLIATAVLHIIVRATGQKMPTSWRLWRLFFVMGAINNLIPFSLIFWGQIRITSGLASILNATTPLWGVLLAHLLTDDERLTTNKLTGVLFGVAGVTLIIGPEALRSLGLNVVAQLAVLGAAVSYAVAGIFGRRFKGIPSLVTAAGQVTGTTVLMIPLVLFVDRPWERPFPTPESWAALIALGLLSTALAYVIYFRLLSTAGATNLLLVTFLIPVSALLLGIFILNEQFTGWHIGGMGLIFLGLAAIDGRLFQGFGRKLRKLLFYTMHVS